MRLLGFRGHPYEFVLPSSFDPAKILLTCRLRKRLDDARWFVATILRRSMGRKSERRPFVHLQAALLKRVMYGPDYAAVIDELLYAKVVERSPYVVRRCSFGYRLSQRYLNDCHVRIAATDDRLIERMRALHEERSQQLSDCMVPVHHALREQQTRLEINGEVAREILRGIPRSNPFDVQGILVKDIEDKRFRFNVGEYGRVTNNITNLKRELRHQLHVNGEPLVCTDIACSQPAFLGKLIQNAGRSTAEEWGTERNEPQRRSIYDSNERLLLCKDAMSRSTADCSTDHFLALVQSGELYEFLLNQLPIIGTRERLKKRLLSDVFAKRKANSHGSEYPSAVEDEFRKLFPDVYSFIRSVNRNGWEHENLIRELQREESRFVIETVAADLMVRNPEMFCITLHDAIYTTPANVRLVEQAFERGFAATGFRMSMKTK